MGDGNNEQVTGSTDGFDIDVIAAELGVAAKAAPKAEEKAEEEKPAAPEATEETGEPEAEKSEEGDGEAEEKEPEETAGEESEEEDAEEEENEESGNAEIGNSKIQKRIDRLTAEKHELREERDAVRAELEALRKQAEAKPAVVTVDPENPLSSVTDAVALEERVTQAQAVLDWADENREGGSVTVDGEEKFYDAEAVKRIRANAKEVVKAAPKQRSYLEQRARVLPEAQAVYPDFFKAGTTAKAFLDATVKEYPWITRIPTWELVVGDAFVGQQMRMARIEQMQRKQGSGKANKSPAAAEAKVHKTPAPAARPKVSSSSEAAALRQRAADVFKSGGRTEAIESYVEALV